MLADKHIAKLIFPVILCTSLFSISLAQQREPIKVDTLSATSIKKIDSSTIQHSPKKAAFRSAVLPGWGQAYNKKYWKIPFVVGALGTTAYVFTYNVKEYKLLRAAFIYRTDTDTSNNALIDPRFRNLSNESIRSYRNSFRQNVDYSVLVFLLFWGLNVIDATVDAHLKAFDVGDDLTLKFAPGYSDMARTSGLSFVLKLKDKRTSHIAAISY